MSGNTLKSLKNRTLFNGQAAHEPFLCLQISTLNLYKNKMVCVTVALLMSYFITSIDVMKTFCCHHKCLFAGVYNLPVNFFCVLKCNTHVDFLKFN